LIPSGFFNALYRKTAAYATVFLLGNLMKLLTAGGEALAAIDRSVALGNERNAGGLAALCANGLEHLAGLALRPTAGLAGVAAGLAAGGLILEALLRIEGLFPGGKHEFIPAIPANQRLVLVHWIIPL
jgi:hypothetical protein